ncbi:hypothetical protein PV327_004538 [Microctonus hyperodae]|uniref:Uncharacterized protein n=1 Tax=Microctonus hyperodae TaxID=165561 RepID=A0AA39KMM7_MICHY|nr:hypothetical protein PV327_004538 [Microctonus hyperodae]
MDLSFHHCDSSRTSILKPFSSLSSSTINDISIKTSIINKDISSSPSNVSTSYQSSNSIYYTPNEDAVLSQHSDVIESKIDIAQHWPKLSRGRMALSSHARFKKIEQIRNFEEQLLMSSTESSMSTLNGTTIPTGHLFKNTTNHPIIHDSLSVKWESCYSNKWKKYSRSSSTGGLINSDMKILSKIENELAPLRGKFSELTGKVKALNLIDHNNNSDIINTEKINTMNYSNDIDMSYLKQERNNYMMKHVHYPGLQACNLMPIQLPQPIYQNEVNTQVNGYNDYCDNGDRVSITILSDKYGVQSSNTIDNLQSNTVSNRDTNLKDYVERHTSTIELPQLDFENIIKSDNPQTMNEHVQMEMLTDSQYDKSNSINNKITIVPVIFDYTTSFDNTTLSQNKLNNPNKLEYGFMNYIPASLKNNTKPLNFKISSAKINNNALDKSCKIAKSKQKKSIRGMTCSPRDFY